MSGTKPVVFYKMCGSGNDFVFLDTIGAPESWQPDAGEIAEVCNRRMGVGADGIVFLRPSTEHAFRMVYLNSDGSRAAFCGNAALCSVSLAVQLGLVREKSFEFEADSGVIGARIHADGNPEVDLPAVRDTSDTLDLPLESDEVRAGFATVGVPHAVVWCKDADRVDIGRRGPVLRFHPATRGGANVDFISSTPSPLEWRMRTFERGVEDETLACGSGAVASAILAARWSGLAGDDEITIRTSSGLPLIVRTRPGPDGSPLPSIRGEGRLVFRGELIR